MSAQSGLKRLLDNRYFHKLTGVPYSDGRRIMAHYRNLRIYGGAPMFGEDKIQYKRGVAVEWGPGGL